MCSMRWSGNLVCTSHAQGKQMDGPVMSLCWLMTLSVSYLEQTGEQTSQEPSSLDTQKHFLGLQLSNCIPNGNV